MNFILDYYGTLLADCLIIAIETIGLVKFLDNFIFPKRDLSLREKCTLELLICIVCSINNSTYMNECIGDICNLFMLALSLTQLAYDCIVHGVPKFLEKMFLGKIDEEKENINNDVEGK